jgi:GntR family transcriptional repressor for pyruvate dehydrogenase complex
MSTMVARPGALSDQVVARLEQRIRSGEIVPGDRLPSERELCAEFGVSRAVLREAIARLKSDGYVETRQGAETVVPAQPGRLSYRFPASSAIDKEDLGHIMELRVAVEVVAAELAAQRRIGAHIASMRRALSQMRDAVRDETDGSSADDQFHQAIAAATRNPHLTRFVEFLRYQFGATRRATWNAHAHQSGEARKAQEEHERLFEAIRAQDVRAASLIATEHLLSSAKRIGLTRFTTIVPAAARTPRSLKASALR